MDGPIHLRCVGRSLLLLPFPFHVQHFSFHHDVVRYLAERPWLRAYVTEDMWLCLSSFLFRIWSWPEFSAYKLISSLTFSLTFMSLLFWKSTRKSQKNDVLLAPSFAKMPVSYYFWHPCNMSVTSVYPNSSLPDHFWIVFRPRSVLTTIYDFWIFQVNCSCSCV